MAILQKILLKNLKKFNVEKQSSPFKPSKAQTFGMYLENNWYSLELKEPPQENLFHIINLDINLLHYYLLEPTLGIGDPRYDNRIDFLAGFHGLKVKTKLILEKLRWIFSLRNSNGKCN